MRARSRETRSPTLLVLTFVCALAAGGCADDPRLSTTGRHDADASPLFDVPAPTDAVATTSSADTAVVVDTAATGDAQDASAVVDSTGADTGATSIVDSGAGQDSVASDTSAPDATAATDTSLPDGVAPGSGLFGFACDDQGGQGCACDGQGDCAVGLACATTPLGRMCAEPCLSSCAGGRRCAAAAEGFDICVPAWATSCAPCDLDADCLERGARCVDDGDDGSFCALPCGAGDSCPDGLSCVALGPDGARRCVPADGTCACPALGEALGASTTCRVAGSACAGTRYCGPEGLTACETGVVGAELCNGVDDDCDGTTDDFTRSCQAQCGSGTQRCTMGAWSACSGPAVVCDPADPCCAADGCGYEPPSLRCDATPTATERRCSGACGGTVEQRQRFRHCSGASADCGAGAQQWSGWTTAQACGASNLCTASGADASCTTCATGCAAGACQTQPTRVICVDPGSYLGTPVAGADADAIIWSVAQHLKSWLDADTAAPQGGGTWSVVLTRAASSNPSNAERRAVCDGAGASRSVSVRINSFTSAAARGSETYHTATTADAWVSFANAVQAQLVAKGGLPDRGVKTSSGDAFLTTAQPSVRAYLGFLTNDADRAALVDDAWRREVARGLLHAIQQAHGYDAYTP